MNTKKGFTLIELLIVIAIIAVLAVAFLPTLLGAPAKGRDTSRIADLQKIQKVLVNDNLSGGTYPATNCVNATNFASYLTAFGGAVPKDPKTSTWKVKTKSNTECDQLYLYVNDPKKADGKSAGFAFGLYAKMDTKEAGNAACTALVTDESVLGAKPTDAADSCYAILTQ